MRGRIRGFCVLFVQAVWIFGGSLSAETAGGAERVEELRSFLAAESRPAVEFVYSLLAERDLVLFDDALHDAVEPWDFYRELVRQPEAIDLDVVFVEVLATSDQPLVDAFLAADKPRLDLLYPALRNDLNGGGWPLETTVDFLLEVHEINRRRPPGRKLRVVGVSNPVFWPGFVRREQYLEFRRVVDLNRDYTMYRVILDAMQNFEAGTKALFLTNTRHAYKAIRNQQGELYWNTGTFFHRFHPDRTAAVRIHSAQLFLSRDPQSGRKKARFDRVDDGAWDAAFAAYGRERIALTLNHGPFGVTDYVGNHMLDALPGQTLADAYDALVFWAPLETIRRSARLAAVYDESTRHELRRRLPIVFGDEDPAQARRAPVERVEEWIGARPEGLHPLTQFP